MKANTKLLAGSLLASTLVLYGCPSTGVYRTAKTLEPGIADIGLSFSAVNAKQKLSTESEGEKVESDEINTVFPKLIPELSFHIGVIPDLELGGRIDILSGYMELDTKYRFLQAADGKLHLAVQPAVGYQTLFVLQGVRAALPIIGTYELNDTFAVNVYGIGQYANLESTLEGESSGDDPLFAYNGFTVGGGAGFMISGESFYFMPSVEYTTLISTLQSSETSSTADLDANYLIISLNMGWRLGQESKKLDKINDKLDKMDEKLDKIVPAQ